MAAYPSASAQHRQTGARLASAGRWVSISQRTWARGTW